MKQLLFVCALFCSTTLFGQIVEIHVGIENMICPICPESLTKLFFQIDGVENCTVIEPESLALISWKSDRPLTTASFYRTLQGTQFIIKSIDIVFDGVVEEKKGAFILSSKPDNTIFYIDNREQTICSRIKNGDKLCVKAALFSQQGCNYIVIKDILPPLAEQGKAIG